LAAQRVASLLADDGENGLMIHQRVIETRNQMRRAGPGGR
jgi:hypothetical protein